ncbi:isopenicillin N synthase family dioxygenase [Lentzea nigeriaca]|uniref:isopenicillin N synthase family dioxygenase n=1 Tax=Lentzea nigeriaca TaxID=1128665 RepID=UPI00195698E6|nr:isopenicillin N synthase family oxygenase [Lentzea nigeriaca]MBM7862391.1 isopenicillin N synthase-like dioxygenase [Lentzea nigeriaca]
MGVPLVDLTGWFDGTRRAEVAARVDAALRESGFLLITGHGVPDELRDRTRELTRRFFALPTEEKEPYAVRTGGRGWLPPDEQATGRADGGMAPPDLKETLTFGSDDSAGDDPFFFRPNVFPGEVPELEPVVTDYLRRMRALADELLTIFAVALGEPEDLFTRHTRAPSYNMNVNHYPPLRQVGPPSPGQFRIGEHTDFGTVTILDRQHGVGGLQVRGADGVWEDAPFDPAAFTVNIGDLMARWVSDRWRSTPHRVLPPDASAPDEDLVSLIFFYNTDTDARIVSLDGRYPEVGGGEYLRAKLAAISIG